MNSRWLAALVLAVTSIHAGRALALPEHNPGPPLTVTVSGPERVPALGAILLVLEIRREMPDAVPLVVHVQVPNGAALMAGTNEASIVDETSPLIAYPLWLRLDRVPLGDLVVTVGARARAYGALATAIYRFGRTANRTVRAALGPELRGPGGIRLGRPVAVERRTAPPVDANVLQGRPRETRGPLR